VLLVERSRICMYAPGLGTVVRVRSAASGEEQDLYVRTGAGYSSEPFHYALHSLYTINTALTLNYEQEYAPSISHMCSTKWPRKVQYTMHHTPYSLPNDIPRYSTLCPIHYTNQCPPKRWSTKVTCGR
jgi:hypothetical protein